MKKLITGAIAAIALVFGFAACSGDLHENEVAPLYIEGVTSARVPMTKVSDTEQIYKFTYSKTLGGWHNTSASIEFKTMVDKDSWARDWGAPKDETVTLKVGDEEYTPLLNREADGVGGMGPGNIEVYDLVEGQEYTIRMKVDMATLKGEIRIEGLSVAAPDMQIIVSTDASGKNAVKIPMTRGGTTYTYEFIAAESKTLYYYFYCSALNNTYYVDNNTLKPVEAKLYDAHGNLLNTDGNVVTDDSYAPDGWKNANKVSILKNHKYSIKIVADETYRGFNGTIKYEVEVDDIDNKNGNGGIFKNAALLGQWKYVDNHDGDYAVDLNEDGTYTFEATNTSVEFKVLRDKSEDTMAWGGKVSIKPGKNYEPGEAKTLTYKTTLVVDKKNGFVYISPKDEEESEKKNTEEKSALKEVDYIKADDLKIGTRYTISIVTDNPNNADFDKFKIYLAEVKPINLTEDVANCFIRGTLNDWGTTNKNDNSTNTQFIFGPFTKVNPEFKFAYGGSNNWNIQYASKDSSPIEIEIGNKKGDKKTITLTRTESGNPGSIKVSGMDDMLEGAEYIITIDVNNAKQSVECTIEITKAGTKSDKSKIDKFVANTYIKGKIASGSSDIKVYAASSTYADDEKSVTIKYGPFPKSYAENEWVLTDDSVSYCSCNLRYIDLKGNKGSEVKLVANGEKNNKITDATFTDDFYYIVIRATTDKDGNIDAVYAKIDPTKDSKIPYPEPPQTVTVTPTFIATGLPEELNGKKLYFTGSFNEWAKPGEEGSIECTVFNGSVSVLLEGIELKADGLKLEGKFASSGWTKPEICGDGGENINVVIMPNAFCVVGTYTSVVDDSDGKKYICDWKVGSANVEATGLPEELNGKKLYFTGSFNEWAKPGEEGSIECTVSNGSVSVLLEDIELKADGLKLEGKFASSGWTKPEICGDGGENINVVIMPNALCIVGTYTSVVDDSDGKKYVCDWTVK